MIYLTAMPLSEMPFKTQPLPNPQFVAAPLVRAHPLLEGVEVAGEGARRTHLPVATVLRHRLGDRFFVDIQTNVENRFGYAFVCR